MDQQRPEILADVVGPQQVGIGGTIERQTGAFGRTVGTDPGGSDRGKDEHTEQHDTDRSDASEAPTEFRDHYVVVRVRGSIRG